MKTRINLITYQSIWATPTISARGALLSAIPRAPAALFALIFFTGCPDLPELFPLSADAASSEAGATDGPRADGALRDGGGEGGTDAGCGPDTENFGEPCGECGLYVCDLDGNLICFDPGLNACDVCGELDDSVGTPGHACGTCGRVTCTAEGLATECTGEHPPNECGGCRIINAPAGEDAGAPLRGPPGTTCSSCGTGEWRCTADRNDLVCFRGRGETSCGGCERCVLYHAQMDQRLDGQYVKIGTVALIEETGDDEDVGSSVEMDTNISLVFDPLIAGPGASALAQAYVFFWPDRPLADFDPYDLEAYMLTPEFAQSIDPDPSSPDAEPIPADLVRRYNIWSFYPLDAFRYVVVFDLFFETIISAGELVVGPPGGSPSADGGLTDTDGTNGTATDAAPADTATSSDAGAADTAQTED